MPIKLREKIEELKFVQKQRERKHGIDVYSLAIGEQDSSSYASISNVDVNLNKKNHKTKVYYKKKKIIISLERSMEVKNRRFS